MNFLLKVKMTGEVTLLTPTIVGDIGDIGRVEKGRMGLLFLISDQL